MAPDLYFAIPGDLETLTGGYVYDRRLAAELTRCGWSIEILSWAASFPHPSEADKAAAAASLAALPDGSLVLVDGLAIKNGMSSIEKLPITFGITRNSYE